MVPPSSSHGDVLSPTPCPAASEGLLPIRASPGSLPSPFDGSTVHEAISIPRGSAGCRCMVGEWYRRFLMVRVSCLFFAKLRQYSGKWMAFAKFLMIGRRIHHKSTLADANTNVISLLSSVLGQPRPTCVYGLVLRSCLPICREHEDA